LTSDKIRKLETEFLKTNLKEKIENEIHTKLCVNFRPEVLADLSKCALIYCWIKLMRKADSSVKSKIDAVKMQ